MDQRPVKNPLSEISGPFLVNLEMTGVCPNNCVHCYNFWRHGEIKAQTSPNMSMEDGDRIMDVLHDIRVFNIVITGGEPLLNKDVMFHILDRVEERGFMTASINSSLISLTEEDVRKLKSYKRLLNILVSLNGSTAAMHDRISGRSGAFEETVRSIKLLVENGIQVPVNMVVSKLNISDITATAALAKSLGCTTFNATRASSPLNCPDFSELSLGIMDFRSYLSDLLSAGRENNIPVGSLRVYPLCSVKETNIYSSACGRSCSAGLTNIAVSPTGDVRPCAQLDEIVGNIVTDPFSDIWENLSGWRQQKYVPQECEGCVALPYCGGGCRAEAKAASGAIDSPDPLMSRVDAEYALANLKRPEKSGPSPAPLSKVNPAFRVRKEDLGYVVFGYGRLVCTLDVRSGEIFFDREGMPVPQVFGLKKLKDDLGAKFVSDIFDRRVIIATEG